ncbi:MAG: LCP family protein [Pseudonocardia sp.]
MPAQEPRQVDDLTRPLRRVEAVSATPPRTLGATPPRTLGRALLITAAATVAPGSGHLLIHRRRTGAVILSTFLLGILAIVVLAATLPRSEFLENLLSTRVLIAVILGCLATALAWIAVIIRTYVLSRPPHLGDCRRVIGATTVAVLCMVVTAPLGLGATLANSQRNLLDTLFPSGGDSSAALEKPRLNILLLGSDAGPDRTGTRTDTMMVASVDTRTGRTTLFGLPRNLGYAQFPLGSAMMRKFPKGFHDSGDPNSGDYLLNAVYAYGHSFPKLAPSGPTRDPGLNLLHSSISHMLGLPIDYYIEVNMAGFAAIIDALGGLRVDVGPQRVPIGGITPSGRQVRPDGYLERGIQQLSGEEALDFARSRTGSTDYVRMGRQRCLIQYVLDQKSPTDLLTNFQGVAKATTNSVFTNIPREMLPALVSLAGGAGTAALESVAFDPNLPDPKASGGRFNTARPNFPYMLTVVRDALTRNQVVAPPVTPVPTTSAAPTTKSRSGGSSATRTTLSKPPPAAAAPTPLAQSC